jgi:hypothetical protein
LTQTLVSQHPRVLRNATTEAYALRDEHIAHIGRAAVTHSREEGSQ